MTCKDCIHYEVCVGWYKQLRLIFQNINKWQDTICSDMFKQKEDI